jgi:hypothetical protein
MAKQSKETADPDSLIILLGENDPKSGWQVVEEDSKKTPKPSKKASPAKKRPRSTRSIWYAVSALVLMALTTALMMRNSEPPRPGLLAGSAELVTSRVMPSNSNAEVPMRSEVLRYFLEVLSTDKVTTRSTGMMPLALGSRFKFHFKPRQSGYFYLLALGKNGRLQTFLTEQPGGQLFMLPRDAQTAPFTIIFSQEPLKSPGFLAMQSGHELNESELQELAELRKRSSSTSPNLVALVDDNQPAVAVQILAERDKSEPLVFDISVKKK